MFILLKHKTRTKLSSWLLSALSLARSVNICKENEIKRQRVAASRRHITATIHEYDEYIFNFYFWKAHTHKTPIKEN